MPVPTARQAQIVARDLHPLVVLRRLEHPLQQLAVARFELVALPQGAACVLDPRRKRVADRLQLAQIENARLGREGRHIRRQLQAAERLSHKPPQLGFEPPDLAPQLGTSEALVAPCPQRIATVSFEQLRHTRPECSSC
jgi:hypothetical protein